MNASIFTRVSRREEKGEDEQWEKCPFLKETQQGAPPPPPHHGMGASWATVIWESCMLQHLCLARKQPGSGSAGSLLV